MRNAVALLLSFVLFGCATDHPSLPRTSEGCHVDRQRVSATITSLSWTGDCIGGLASGRGVLTAKWNDGFAEIYNGNMSYGKRSGEGSWSADEEKLEGFWVDNALVSGSHYSKGKLFRKGTFRDDLTLIQGEAHFPSGNKTVGIYDEKQKILAAKQYSASGEFYAYNVDGQAVSEAVYEQRVKALAAAKERKDKLEQARLAQQSAENERKFAKEERQRRALEAENAATTAALTQALVQGVQQYQQAQRPRQVHSSAGVGGNTVSQSSVSRQLASTNSAVQGFPYPDANLCISVKEQTRGTRCGSPSSMYVEIQNTCSQPVKLRLCLRRADGKWSCGSKSHAEPRETLSNFVCDSAGRYETAGCLVSSVQGKRFRNGNCGGDPEGEGVFSTSVPER
jgi:hypothetical protein